MNPTYIILDEKDGYEMQKSVTEWMMRGWVVAGGITVLRHNNTFTYYQAMIDKN